MTRHGLGAQDYPADVSGDDRAPAATYLTLLRDDAGQREHSLREMAVSTIDASLGGRSWRRAAKGVERVRISWTSAALVLLATPGAMAQAGSPLPACALSGAASVMIGGRPVLRLSDVATCPPELYEVVPSIRIEGQPAIRFRFGGGITGACSATGDPSVRFERQAAPRLGDVDCRGK